MRLFRKPAFLADPSAPEYFHLLGLCVESLLLLMFSRSSWSIVSQIFLSLIGWRKFNIEGGKKKHSTFFFLSSAILRRIGTFARFFLLLFFERRDSSLLHFFFLARFCLSLIGRSAASNSRLKWFFYWVDWSVKKPLGCFCTCLVCI